VGASLSVAELLAPFRADPIGSAIFTDFDGTLAPIVDDPAAARPLPGGVDVLGRLARRYGVVGVVSGRPVAFLQAHLGGHGLSLFGLYGLESASAEDEVSTAPEVARWLAVVDSVAAPTEAGLDLEHKGLSVTVHFRRQPDRAEVAKRWADDQAAATGLVVHPGRRSYELRPPVELDKGSVVAAAAGGRRTMFLGDDQADLAAFDALDRMAAGGTTVVRVAVTSPEAPPELLARADLVVDGPEGALSVLRALLAE
jgi:trehalose 6-phosphate phosphatase